MPSTAIYPGSFDPVTYGHLDIIERGLEIFDRVVVTILSNPAKSTLFSLEERRAMLEESLAGKPNVEVDHSSGLLVDYVAGRGENVILRGMRAVSDFEYEFQMALMNRKLNRDVQTVFLMTGLRWIFTSSSIIKQAAQFGGDVDDMVPPQVSRRLRDKFGLVPGAD